MGLVLILIQIHKMLKIIAQFGKCEHRLFDNREMCLYVHLIKVLPFFWYSMTHSNVCHLEIYTKIFI